MNKHYKLNVFGRVQGVGYRFACMEAAYKFNVKGFVKNRHDRSVYIEAEGKVEDINKFREWCKKGPMWARVNEVKEVEGDFQSFKSFDIIR